ncbi:hypothetical protein ACJMK2_028384 [Sinanodonta woodiana]|uniref:Uncharacterized protein n=1 Tax=Sinanodonta woodiana TaxID=1069815 RepID=A0ABD3X963_SINWO
MQNGKISITIISVVRAEMEMNPSSQRALPYYNTFYIFGIVVCGSVAVTIHEILFYSLFPAYIPILLLMIIVFASKCKKMDLFVIFVHFETIICTLWFLTVLPAFVLACVMSVNIDRFTYRYSYRIDVRLIAVAVISGTISCTAAAYTVAEIWKYAQHVVLRSRSGERNLDYRVVRVLQRNEASASCTDCNGMGAGEGHCDDQVLIL